MSAAIAGWLVSGAAGVGVLAAGCWYAAKRAWRTRPDVAPRVSLPSLHELRARHRR
jgi:hypothetical protein